MLCFVYKPKIFKTDLNIFNLLKTTTLLFPTTPLFCNPRSTQSSLRKVGQFPPTSQSERRSIQGAESPGCNPGRNIRLGCRNKAFCFFSVFQHHLSDPSIWLTRERNLPIKWSCGRRVEVIRSVDIYIYVLLCLVKKFLGEGSCKVQRRKFSSMISDFFIFFPIENIYINCSWSQTLLPACYVNSIFWSLANLLSLHAKGKKTKLLCYLHI